MGKFSGSQDRLRLITLIKRRRITIPFGSDRWLGPEHQYCEAHCSFRYYQEGLYGERYGELRHPGRGFQRQLGKLILSSLQKFQVIFITFFSFLLQLGIYAFCSQKRLWQMEENVQEMR